MSQDDAEQRARALVTFKHAIRQAMDGDPSMLALHVTRARVPSELMDVVYVLIVDAPWRIPKPRGGRPRAINWVDEIGIGTLYQFLTLDSDEPLGKTKAKKRVADQYGVSMSTIATALTNQGLVKKVQKPWPIKKRR